MVRLEGLRKVYDNDVVAVHGADIVINEGEFVVLVGPSGCGKSTTLRMIAGLEEITSGTLTIDDKKVNDVLPKDRDIAMVFQNYALYPHMTVYKNMAFGLELRKFPKKEIVRRVNDAAEILGLEDVLDRRPKELSGGQRQRVAVGRAIVRDPRVFLFDEPLSNLDAKLRVQMRTEISKLHKQLGSTIIYVTHDQIEAMTMGDRIVVMNEGKIEQIDTPHELYLRPRNKFVAGFIGSPSMNFFTGELHSSDGINFRHADSDLSVCVPDEIADHMSGNDVMPVILGIRPEDIFLAGSPHIEGPPSEIEMNVNLVEHMGNEVTVYGLSGTTQVVARLRPDAPVSQNGTVALAFSQNKMHFFDSTTEESLR